mgnify:CR=1 FL=1
MVIAGQSGGTEMGRGATNDRRHFAGLEKLVGAGGGKAEEKDWAGKGDENGHAEKSNGHRVLPLRQYPCCQKRQTVIVLVELVLRPGVDTRGWW